MLPRELPDFVRRPLSLGNYVYLVSFDIEGAFDAIPRRHLAVRRGPARS